MFSTKYFFPVGAPIAAELSTCEQPARRDSPLAGQEEKAAPTTAQPPGTGTNFPYNGNIHNGSRQITVAAAVCIPATAAEYQRSCAKKRLWCRLLSLSVER